MIMVNMYNHTQHLATMNTSSQEYVYRKFDELKTAIRWDTFNLTRSQQERLENQLAELRKQMEEYYVANIGEH